MKVYIVSSDFFLFPQKKCVCPEKSRLFGFLGCSKIKYKMNITLRSEKVFIKSKGVLKCWDCRLSDGLVEKIVLNEKYGALWDFTRVQLEFLEQQLLLESVSFHSQMLSATIFGLVLGHSIVIAIIFIKKYIVSVLPSWKLSGVGILAIKS